jgi:shikimate dehydrogenase
VSDLLVLLGRPVRHSLSPAMQNAAFAASGLDARYLALEVADFDAGWEAVRRLAVRGGNVTVPWKEAAFRAVDSASERARRVRSVNTFWRTPEGALAGTETDGPGFLRAFEDAWNGPPAGLRFLLLGTGGAGRAVAHALAEAGAAELHLWNRTRQRAVALVEELRAAAPGTRVDVLDRLPGPAAGAEVDVAVNATSTGLDPASPPPLDPSGLPGLRLAMDLAYGTRPTAFVAAARRAGIAAADGRGMLLHQGALAFEAWFSRPAPLGVMREALAAALG